MDRLAFRCSANACFMPSEEYPAFSQNSTRGKTTSPIGVFSPILSVPTQPNGSLQAFERFFNPLSGFHATASSCASRRRISASCTRNSRRRPSGQGFSHLIKRARLDCDHDPFSSTFSSLRENNPKEIL